MIRRSAQSVLALLLAATAWFALPRHAAAQNIDGRWTWDSAASDNVNAAVDRAIARMNFITRPVARRRLRNATNPAHTLLVERTADAVSMTVDIETPIRMPADGTRAPWTRRDGEVVQVSGVAREGVFVQSFHAEDGNRTNTYRIRDDGALELRVVITSARLPSVVEYTLVYRPAT
jgi:hypothetical protein